MTEIQNTKQTKIIENIELIKPIIVIAAHLGLRPSPE